MVIAKSVFQEGNKYYPQVLLYECVYKSINKLWKVCIILLVIFSRQSFIFISPKAKMYQTCKWKISKKLKNIKN